MIVWVDLQGMGGVRLTRSMRAALPTPPSMSAERLADMSHTTSVATADRSTMRAAGSNKLGIPPEPGRDSADPATQRNSMASAPTTRALDVARDGLNESPSRRQNRVGKPASCAVLTRTLAFSVLAGAGVLSTMLLPCQALAQDPVPSSGTTKADGDAADASATPRTSGGRKRISLDDEFLVEGKLEKPSAFFVFKRSAVDYDWARLDAQFTPLVLESVQDPLF